MSRILLHMAIALSALTTGVGCAKRLRVLNPTVDRAPMVYESGQAQSTFERALMKRYARGDAAVGKSSQLSRNAYYNQQVHVADENLDGIISEAEAHRYARKANL